MITFSTSTSLYFYSALLQGNAALISVVAMFLVYRKQNLDLSFEKIERMIVDYYCHSTHLIVNYKNIFFLESYNENDVKDLPEQTRRQVKTIEEDISWKKRFEELRAIDNQRNELWIKAMPPIRLVFFILMASVVMLPISDQLHLVASVELFAFVIFVLCEIHALSLLFRFIRSQFV